MSSRDNYAVTVDVVMLSDKEVPNDLGPFFLEQFYPSDHISIIRLGLDYLGDEHLNVLDRLYKDHEILAWATEEANSSTYNL